MEKIDIFIHQYFSVTRNLEVTQFFYLVTTMFDLSFSFLIILFCVTWLIYLVRNLKYSLFFLATIFSSTVLVYFMKFAFNVSRPEGGAISAFGQSFPSYHATISTVFFILLIYIFDDFLGGVKRKIFNFLCVFFILLVSISRVYLGVHWFSDVFFGLVFGVVISYASIVIFRKVNSVL